MTTTTEIPAGRTTVRITRTEYVRKETGQVVPQHIVRFHDGLSNRQFKFKDESAAKAKAQEAVELLKRGDAAIMSLTDGDRHMVARCKSLLEPLQIPLSVAVEEYVHAKAKLPTGVSFGDAIEFYLKQGRATACTKTVRDVISEFLASKLATGYEERYLGPLESMLRPFERAYDKPLAQVMIPDEIVAHLDSSTRTPEYWVKRFKIIRSLYSYAVKRKYLPPDVQVDLGNIDLPKVTPKETEIFTVAEARLILSHAKPEMVPWLAIAMFCGIRHAELNRIDWSQINLAEGHIHMTAAKTKTRARRLVQIPDNLKAWLATSAKESGPLLECENTAHELKLLTRRIQKKHPEFKWKQNAIRHSFISYRLAQTNDENMVAQQAGNSPSMIVKHYRALVTKQAGDEWFGIMPNQ